MPKYIVEHVCEDGAKRYLIWSTIVDAPLTFGATLEKIFDVWRDQYGQSGVERLKSDLDRGGFDNLDDVIACNRAGKDESRLTREQIVDFYFERRGNRDDPPMGRPLWSE